MSVRAKVRGKLRTGTAAASRRTPYNASPMDLFCRCHPERSRLVARSRDLFSCEALPGMKSKRDPSAAQALQELRARRGVPLRKQTARLPHALRRARIYSTRKGRQTMRRFLLAMAVLT